MATRIMTEEDNVEIGELIEQPDNDERLDIDFEDDKFDGRHVVDMPLGEYAKTYGEAHEFPKGRNADQWQTNYYAIQRSRQLKVRQILAIRGNYALNYLVKTSKRHENNLKKIERLIESRVTERTEERRKRTLIRSEAIVAECREKLMRLEQQRPELSPQRNIEHESNVEDCLNYYQSHRFEEYMSNLKEAAALQKTLENNETRANECKIQMECTKELESICRERIESLGTMESLMFTAAELLGMRNIRDSEQGIEFLQLFPSLYLDTDTFRDAIREEKQLVEEEIFISGTEDVEKLDSKRKELKEVNSRLVNLIGPINAAIDLIRNFPEYLGTFNFSSGLEDDYDLGQESEESASLDFAHPPQKKPRHAHEQYDEPTTSTKQSAAYRTQKESTTGAGTSSKQYFGSK